MTSILYNIWKMFFISISFVSLPNAKRFKCFLYKASAIRCNYEMFPYLYQLKTDDNILFIKVCKAEQSLI